METLLQTELDNNAHLFFPVQEMPIYNQQGELIKGYKQLRNGATDQLLSVQKESYQVLTNEECLVKTMTYLDKHFITEGMIIQPRSAPDGTIVRYDFTLPHYQHPVRDSKVMLKASMFNSLNGTRSFILIISYVYEICTNGLGHNLWDVHISKRHSSKKELVLETNAKQLCNLHQVASRLNGMCMVDITESDMDRHTNMLCFQPTYKDKSHVNQQCKKYILDEYESYSKRYGKNLFSAYQAWTHWATHYPSASINTVYDRQRKVAGMKILN